MPSYYLLSAPLPLGSLGFAARMQKYRVIPPLHGRQGQRDRSMTRARVRALARARASVNATKTVIMDSGKKHREGEATEMVAWPENCACFVAWPEDCACSVAWPEDYACSVAWPENHACSVAWLLIVLHFSTNSNRLITRLRNCSSPNFLCWHNRDNGFLQQNLWIQYQMRQ